MRQLDILTFTLLLTHFLHMLRNLLITELCPCGCWETGTGPFISSYPRETGKGNKRRGCLCQHESSKCDESCIWTVSSHSSSKWSKNNNSLAFWLQCVFDLKKGNWLGCNNAGYTYKTLQQWMSCSVLEYRCWLIQMFNILYVYVQVRVKGRGHIFSFSCPQYKGKHRFVRWKIMTK